MYGEIEGSGFEVIDRRFAACFAGHVRLERLWTGARWSEGPSWFAAGRYLLFSDIPNDRILRYDDTDGSVSVFRQPAASANGNTVDRQGRLVTCEHLTRRVTRTEFDGTVTVLAESYRGRRLNSPNDVVVTADGATWFTDPSYGIMADYEGSLAEREQDGDYVFRLAGGTLQPVATDFDRPNGLAFSPDESCLYIVDSAASHDAGAARHIRRFGVGDNGALSGGEVFATCTAGIFDGLRVDRADRLWCSAADGVHCYDADGTLIGRILVPEIVGNLTFGGARLNRMFICGTTSLYSLFLLTNGCCPG